MNNIPRITCQYHTDRPIIFVNLAQETHNTPRLLCSKCQITLWKFGPDNLQIIDFDDVNRCSNQFLSDPNLILDPTYNKTYIEFTTQYQKILNTTIDEQLIDECLNNYASKIIDLLAQTKKQFKEQVQQFTILKKHIEVFAAECSQRTRHQQIIQLHSQILQEKLTHQSPQYKELLASVNVMVEKITKLDEPIYLNAKLQTENMMNDYRSIQPQIKLENDLHQLSQKLRDTLQSIMNGLMDKQVAKPKSCVNEFQRGQSEQQLYRSCKSGQPPRKLSNNERSESLPAPQQDDIKFDTKLLPIAFQDVVLNQIEKYFHITKVQLIFSLKTEGKSFGAVWRSILSKAPTLMLIRVHTGKTIGAFSPVQWIENNEQLCDGHGQSFLFSVDRKEIYPLKSDFKGNAIYAFSDGSKMDKRIFQIGGADFLINSDFIIEYADLSAELQDIKSLDPELYLFNTKLAKIEEFEIYHLT